MVQNLAPGAAARLGLGLRRLLAAKKPAIIVCDISGYGADGPYRDKKAYDLLIQSEAGFVSVTGTPGRAVQGRPVDRRHRRRHVRVHQHPRRAAAARPDRARPAHRHLDAGVAGRMDQLPALLRLRRRAAAAAHRRRHATIYPYGPFPTGDGGTRDAGPAERARMGQLLRQGAAAARSWRPTRASPATPSAWRSGTRCAQIIVEAFAPLTAPQVVERLEAAQIANARVNTMHEVWAHPQLKARGRWREVGSPAGPVPALLPPGTWDDGPAHGPGARAGRAHRRHPGRAGLRRGRRSARCAPAEADLRWTAPRTYLFVPGNRPERFAKALASGADAVVLDLEDAVAAADQGRRARRHRALVPRRPTRATGARIVVRINDAESP